MPENDAHIPGMNAVSFVAYCGELAGLPRVDAMQRAHEVLFYVGLGEARYRNVETYSTGMKQRIKLAQALVHDPDLLFLDEPTNGMDPKGRDEMLELVRDLAHNKGVNLILSSHLLPDVEYTCDHVVVMDKGADRRRRADRGAEGAARPRLRAAREDADGDSSVRRSGCAAPASSATRPTKTSCACSCRAKAARATLFALAAARARPGAAPAAERADARRRVRATRWARSELDADSRSGLPALRRRRERDAARAWLVIARPASGRCFAKRAFLGLLLLSPGCRSSCARCRSTSSANFPQARVPRADGRDVPRVPRAAGASSCSSSRSTSAPG